MSSIKRLFTHKKWDEAHQLQFCCGRLGVTWRSDGVGARRGKRRGGKEGGREREKGEGKDEVGGGGKGRRA